MKKSLVILLALISFSCFSQEQVNCYTQGYKKVTDDGLRVTVDGLANLCSNVKSKADSTNVLSCYTQGYKKITDDGLRITVDGLAELCSKP